jgi:hypothetical protein
MMKNKLLFIIFSLMAIILCACHEEVSPVREETPAVYLNPSDSLVMVKVYESLKLEESRVEWNLSRPDSWMGVEFDTIKNVAYVSGLNVTTIWISPALKPQLPPEIGQLSHLSSLKMYYCDFSGCLPGELFDCPLEKLCIYSNQNRDTEEILPDEIRNVSGTLKILDIQKTYLRTLPEGVGELKNLEKLILSENRLTGKVPEYMFQLPGTISLDSNRYTDVNWYDVYFGMKAFHRLPSLAHNYISGKFPEELADLRDEIRGYFNPPSGGSIIWE